MILPETEPTRTPRPSPPASLSEEHRRKLEEESGISPKVARERGYYTALRRSEMPEAFAGYQRKTAPALVMPLYSPDGQTQSYQIRPDAPRCDEKGKPIKYETPDGGPVIVDVHPWVLDTVREGRGDLWITEGAKKGDALLSRGEAALVLAGVWMATVPKVRPFRLLPCWDHVRLAGRRLYVAYDSDVTTKPNVGQALEVLVQLLEERGAEVLVVYLPDKPDGNKMGIDDYLAAGGTVEELRAHARPFDREDLACARLCRDERLQAAIAAEWSRWWSYDWSRMVGTGENPDWRRGHTSRDLMKALIDEGKRCGKVEADVLEVSPSTRRLAELSAKSRPSVGKGLRHLEAEGFIEIAEAKTADKPHTYRLLAGSAVLYQEGGTGEASGGPSPGGKGPRGGPDVPRLRWSSPASPKRRGVVRDTRRVRQGPPPAARAGVKRLNPGRGAAVDYMEREGRPVPLAEIAEALGVARPRDLVRRKATEKGRDGRLVMLLDVGILVFDGEAFDLPPDWRSRLEEARELGKEIEREDLERERHRRQREAFRNRHKTEPTHHYANDPNADGHIEELRPGDEPEDASDEETPVSQLAAAIRDYLDRNPHDAAQPPGWLGVTVWVEGLHPKLANPAAAAKVALEELGGDRYRRELLQRGRSRRGAA